MRLLHCREHEQRAHQLVRQLGIESIPVDVEDNEAVIKLVGKARSMALRHLPRTHRIDLHWLFEVCDDVHVRLRHVGTREQAADIFTKAFSNADLWRHLLQLIQMVPANGYGNRTVATPVKTMCMLFPGVPGQHLCLPPRRCGGCGLGLATASTACMFCTS